MKNMNKLIMAILCVLVLPVVMSANEQFGEQKSPRIINIVNFIRQCEPRIEGITEDVLYNTVVEQIKVLKKYELKGTFLLQHDALLDPRYQKLLKTLPNKMYEVGAWWEIPQTLVENAEMKWRGRYQWDYHADVGFATGYTPAERIKLVDTYMADFKKVFGYYPKSVGSWFIDAITLEHMYDKYGIVASCNCKDQIGTDGYTLWGGYWNQGYYPSRKNAYMPAQNEEKQIPVPIFRMLGSDPIHQYDNGLGTGRQRVISLEPVYNDSGANANWCKWYFDQFVNGDAMTYGYVQAGQENSFTWRRMKQGYEIQMPMIKKLLNIGEVQVQTLAETGKWFKNNFKVTPPTSVTVLKDHSEKDQKTVWFNSRFYRANLLWDKDTMRLRDIHIFDESVESSYLNKRGVTSKCHYYALPVVDGFNWSSEDTVAGLRFKTSDGSELKGQKPLVRVVNDDMLAIEWPTTSTNGYVLIKFNEKTMTIFVKGDLQDNFYIELSADSEVALPFKDIAGKKLSYSYLGNDYSVFAKQGEISMSDSGFKVFPDSNKIVLDFSVR